jgi:hypothetical protein
MSEHDWSQTRTGDEHATCARCGLSVRYSVKIVARAGGAHHLRSIQEFRRHGSSQWTLSREGGRGLPRCTIRAKQGAGR